MRRSAFAAFAFISGATLMAGRAAAQTATTPGAITTPYPTSQGISIEWAITGDSNANGVVTVRYRPNGGAWKTGMPLVRVPAGSNTTGTFGTGGSWTNKHAGSLFDLQEGQIYEIELTLNDPDGGSMTATPSVAAALAAPGPTGISRARIASTSANAASARSTRTRPPCTADPAG